MLSRTQAMADDTPKILSSHRCDQRRTLSTALTVYKRRMLSNRYGLVLLVCRYDESTGAQGVSKQNRKSKMKTEMKKEHGADWRLVQTCSPSFFCSEKINDFQPTAKIKKLSTEKRKQIESTNSNNSACPIGQRSHVRISHQDCRTQHTTHS